MEKLQTVQKKRFIESSSFYTNNDRENPFSEMEIEDSSFLENVPSRSCCPKCNKSRRYYCYTCYVAVQELSNLLPVVSLPVQIDIIKHPKEVDGKSTSAHAAVLAPEDVKIYTYPDFPSYENEKVLLVFPGKSALTFQEWWAKQQSCTLNECNKRKSLLDLPCNETLESFNDKRNLLPFTKIIFIDSTWKQSKALYSDSRIKRLPCIILSSRKSLFWRPQRGKPDTYLATIEAIYYFLLELYNLMFPNEDYDGRYDNMLFFFKYMYFKIKSVYDEEKSIAEEADLGI